MCFVVVVVVLKKGRKNTQKMMTFPGVSRLRSHHCHCCGSGSCCGGCRQKKKIKKKINLGHAYKVYSTTHEVGHLCSQGSRELGIGANFMNPLRHSRNSGIRCLLPLCHWTGSCCQDRHHLCVVSQCRGHWDVSLGSDTALPSSVNHILAWTGTTFCWFCSFPFQSPSPASP